MARKKAVDSTARAYWSAYFGDYGDQLVKEKIPRRVAQRVVAELKSAARVVGVRIGHFGAGAFARTVKGGLLFEGVAQVRTADRKVQTHVFAAEFDAKGAITSFKLAA